MADAIDNSVSKLNGAVEKRLSQLNKSISTQELGEMHNFVKEAKGLLDTLMSMNGNIDDYGFEEEYDESSEVFTDMFIQACHLINSLYTLIDDHKIKETNSEWIFEEIREFMEFAKELYGPRIPVLSNMRLVSKKKKVKEK
jgi:hypothetical protein